MVMDLGSLVVGGLSGHGLTTFWNAIPEGVKHRCGQGIDRLTGKLTRRWDREDKKEDADVADDIKREDNKSEAQKKVLDLLVPDVAKAISADPVLMERATIEMMGDAYRKQENKDAVAEEALKDIGEKHTDNSSTNEPLDEDWLNMFSSYAEKASTERTRQLWGRILSGEVRHPGRFSLSTLRVLSEIDKRTAEAFVEISSFVMDDGILYPKKYKNENFLELLRLENAGLINGITSPLVKIFSPPEDKQMILRDHTIVAFITCNKIEKLEIDAIILTKSGYELIKTIDFPEKPLEKIKMLEESLKENKNILSYNIHNVIKIENEQTLYSPKPIASWNRDKRNL